MTIGGILSGLSPNYESLVVFRGMVGFGVGGCSVPFDLLAEFLPAKERGNFLMFIEYFWTVGSMFIIFMAWWLLIVFDWRALCVITSIPVGVACLYGIKHLPESPRWLLIKERPREAEVIVKEAARINGVDLGNFSLTISPMEIADAKRESETPFYLAYLPLFEGTMIYNTLPMLTVWLCFSFMYYGLILFITRVYSTSNDDGPTCSFDYPPILENSTVEFLGTTVVLLCVNKLGRVRSQVYSYSVCGMAMLLMGLLNRTPAAFILFAMVGRASAMGGACATWVS